MTDAKSHFSGIAGKMRGEKLPELAIETFKYYYEQLLEGSTGLIPEDSIKPVESLPHADELDDYFQDIGAEAIRQTVMINLNGGLGTSMGLEKAKSLLTVKEGMSFLEILARQAIKAGVPLVLMNSFATQADSLEELQPFAQQLKMEIPLDFVQHKVPKIDKSTMNAANWPDNPTLEWCPPGHGDIYTALVTSGMLETLLANGYRYAFVSNADNLGASLDEKILGYFAENNFPFMSEMARRTEADKKGGHLAIRKEDDHLILREVAQTSEEDLAAFQDVNRHRFFNTNSLWLNLEALKDTMESRGNVLGLPMIRNEKTVDPRNPESPGVFQLETAMAAAIAAFENSQAIEVPRTRFAPVKTTEDLIVVRSDATVINDDYLITPNPARESGTVVVHLDKAYYKLVDDFEARFPNGVPSLLECSSLTIEGDVAFEGAALCIGDVIVRNSSGEQKTLPAGSKLSGTVEL